MRVSSVREALEVVSVLASIAFTVLIARILLRQYGGRSGHAMHNVTSGDGASYCFTCDKAI